MKLPIRDRPDLYASNALWRQALKELRLQMTRATYEAWLAHSHVIESTSSPAGLTVAVRNNYAKEWLVNSLQDVVNRTVSAVVGQPVTVAFVVNSSPQEDPIMLDQGNPKNEDLGQPISEDLLPRNIRQTRRIDMFLTKAGIIPTYALDLPQNIALGDILLRGGQDPMTTQHASTRIRVYSHVTQSTFLHVEDALGIGKLRLFAGAYQRGRGITANAHHFLDTADARVVLLALAQTEPGFAYREYKGSANGETDVISRVFSVKAKGDRIYLELENGPGQLTNTGAIKPTGQPAAEITIPFKTYEARRLALETLAYLQAWDTVRLATHRESVSGLPPYLLSPPPPDSFATDPANDASGSQVSKAESKAPAGESEDERAAETAPAGDGKGKAVLEQARQIHEDSFDPDAPPNPPSQLLHYQDGMLVAPANGDERRAFLQYRESRGEDPGSLGVLRRWYGQHNQG